MNSCVVKRDSTVLRICGPMSAERRYNVVIGMLFPISFHIFGADKLVISKATMFPQNLRRHLKTCRGAAVKRRSTR